MPVSCKCANSWVTDTDGRTGMKYPDITVKLTGTDSNAFSIIGKVKDALLKAKISKAEVDEFMTEATSGDYDNVLRTCMGWVNVE